MVREVMKKVAFSSVAWSATRDQSLDTRKMQENTENFNGSLRIMYSTKCLKMWCKFVVTGEKMWHLPWYPYWCCHHHHHHILCRKGPDRFTWVHKVNNNQQLAYFTSFPSASSEFPTRIQSLNKDCDGVGMWMNEWFQKIAIKVNFINICILDAWQMTLLILSGLWICRIRLLHDYLTSSLLYCSQFT